VRLQEGCVRRNKHLQLDYSAVATAAPLVELQARDTHAHKHWQAAVCAAITCCFSSSITKSRFFAISATSASDATHTLKPREIGGKTWAKRAGDCGACMCDAPAAADAFNDCGARDGTSLRAQPLAVIDTALQLQQALRCSVSSSLRRQRTEHDAVMMGRNSCNGFISRI
jgi:hypothetical protein